MISIIGSGYIGSRFVSELQKRGSTFRVLSHVDVEAFSSARKNLEGSSAVINCCAFIKNGRADDCEDDKASTWIGNFALPITISNACESLGIPFMQVSTACLYTEQKSGEGWSESDAPQLSYRSRQDCGTYVASKVLVEEVLERYDRTWIARVRLPFDNIDHPRNYLSKLRNYPKVYDNCNTLAHRGDFVEACLRMVGSRVPFGTYNVLNRGAIWAHEIISMMNQIPSMAREFRYWDDTEFLRTQARTPKSNCTISSQKLRSVGIEMRDVSEAVQESLYNWIKL